MQSHYKALASTLQTNCIYNTSLQLLQVCHSECFPLSSLLCLNECPVFRLGVNLDINFVSGEDLDGLLYLGELVVQLAAPGAVAQSVSLDWEREQLAH